jgi:hypothetical protein
MVPSVPLAHAADHRAVLEAEAREEGPLAAAVVLVRATVAANPLVLSPPQPTGPLLLQLLLSETSSVLGSYLYCLPSPPSFSRRTSTSFALFSVTVETACHDLCLTDKLPHVRQWFRWMESAGCQATIVSS